MSNVPLPEPDCRLPMDGPPRYRADQMHAHAAAVSAAKDKEMAQLRAELLKSLADNAALRADAIDRQNNVVAPLRAEVAGLREDAERYRWLRHGDNDERVIKRGPVAHDFVYLLRMEKLDAAIDAARKGTTPTRLPPSPSPRS